jgi:hypothetical protein
MNGRQSSRGYGNLKTRGDQIAGVLVNKEPRDNANGTSARYYIENQDGMFLVWGSAITDDRMQLISDNHNSRPGKIVGVRQNSIAAALLRIAA